jgi:hypothetical protein
VLVTTITACIHHSGGGLYEAAKYAKGDRQPVPA